MGAHARFSPSASKRYLNCPPAQAWEIPQPNGPYPNGRKR